MTTPQRYAAGEGSACNTKTKQFNNKIKIRVYSMFEDLVNKHCFSHNSAEFDDIRKQWFIDGEFDGDSADELDADPTIINLRSAGLKVEIVRAVDINYTCEASSEFKYSIGTNRYDNIPKQLAVKDFDAFATDVLDRRSKMKGETYFCSAFSFGSHSDTEKFPDVDHYRSAISAEPRRFLPIDFDGFKNTTAFTDAFKYLDRYKGFGYTTWSHTALAPRARAVLELDLEVSREQGVLVGEAFQRQMIQALGSDFALFDDCVYRGEQPVYGAPPNATIFNFEGTALGVDKVLASFPSIVQKPKLNSHMIIDATTACLAGSLKSGAETEENIVRVKSALSAIDPDCDRAKWRDICYALHSLGWSCSEQLARSWSRGELL